jgi:hypothetical protein
VQLEVVPAALAVVAAALSQVATTEGSVAAVLLQLAAVLVEVVWVLLGYLALVAEVVWAAGAPWPVVVVLPLLLQVPLLQLLLSHPVSLSGATLWPAASLTAQVR